MSLAERILEQPMELIEGVEETLAYLAGAARSDAVHQRASGGAAAEGRPLRLGALFRAHRDREGKGRAGVPAAGRGAPASHPGVTWMIGNSPKSDINPALEAGLNAVLVPHPHTWVLEHQDLRDGGTRLLKVERFADLRSHF